MNLYDLAWSTILFAFFLDLIIGDPRWLTHPVVLIGKLISFLEGLFRSFAKGKSAELFGGIILAIIVPAVAFIVTYRLMQIANHLNPWLGWLVAVFLAYTTIAARSLYVE
ncbi:MAG: cobalamin biosynthesis protein, partial [Candidatus Desantisbacteria bacterium]